MIHAAIHREDQRLAFGSDGVCYRTELQVWPALGIGEEEADVIALGIEGADGIRARLVLERAAMFTGSRLAEAAANHSE